MSVETKKIFALNLGSTSTKVAYFENDNCVFKKTIKHSAEKVRQTKNVFDQYDFRREDIENFMAENGIKTENLDAIVARGGLTEPVEGGTYIVEQDLLDQIRSGQYGLHPCSLGCQIAYDLVKGTNVLPLTVDMPGTCEYNKLAFYSGLPEITRIPMTQILNDRIMGYTYAESIGKNYEDMNIIMCMLGGGVCIAVHEKGKMVDAHDGVLGDGTFSNNRCNGVPIGPLIDMCYSGKYTYEEMKHKVNGEAGLMGYLGTVDVIEIEKEAKAGNEKYREVLEAMCYQIAKDIGAYATVVNGKVDAILITGGMAHSKYITGMIKERVEFIAPVAVMPGEKEMEALGVGAYRALVKEVPTKHFSEGKINA